MDYCSFDRRLLIKPAATSFGTIKPFTPNKILHVDRSI